MPVLQDGTLAKGEPCDERSFKNSFYDAKKSNHSFLPNWLYVYRSRSATVVRDATIVEQMQELLHTFVCYLKICLHRLRGSFPAKGGLPWNTSLLESEISFMRP